MMLVNTELWVLMIANVQTCATDRFDHNAAGTDFLLKQRSECT
jgi:hypothetical protein